MKIISNCLYHWAPTRRRDAILRKGLCVGSPNTTASEPLPYISFGPDPALAWSMSAGTGWCDFNKWDLWMAIFTSNTEDASRRFEDGAVVEVKVYEDVPRSRIMLLAWVDFNDKEFQ